MRYWNGKGPKVIVVDGTDESIPKCDLDALGPSILYVHNPVGFYERLRGVLDLITTKYVALAGDDEFYIPSAVARCINELEHDPEMVACCGRALGFSPGQKYAVNGWPCYPLLKGYVLEADDPEQRLTEHLVNYVPSLIYAVSKTDDWKKSWRHTLLAEFPAFATFELQVEMCMSIAGKSKVLPELMWLRSCFETEPVRNTDESLDPEKSFRGWWLNPANAGDKDRFLSLMSDAFADILGQSGDRRDWVVRAIEAYQSSYPEQQRNLSLKQYAKDVIKGILPKPYREKIRGVLKSLRSARSQPAVSLATAAESLQAEGVNVDFAALRNIEETIVSFHRNAEGRGAL
jgi:glycosyltransferase domain-containing protein